MGTNELELHNGKTFTMGHGWHAEGLSMTVHGDPQWIMPIHDGSPKSMADHSGLG